MQRLDRADGGRDGRAWAVVGSRDAALGWPLGLGSVQGRAVHHDLDYAVDGRRHPHQLHFAEEAAVALPLALEQLVVAGHAQGEDNHCVNQSSPTQDIGHAPGHGEQDDDAVHAGELRDHQGPYGEDGRDQCADPPLVEPSPAPRPRQAGQAEHDGVFPHGVEDHRRDEGVERPAYHPAKRHRQIEVRQPGGRRAATRQRLVADQGGEEEGAEVGSQLPEPWRL